MFSVLFFARFGLSVFISLGKFKYWGINDLEIEGIYNNQAFMVFLPKDHSNSFNLSVKNSSGSIKQLGNIYFTSFIILESSFSIHSQEPLNLYIYSLMRENCMKGILIDSSFYFDLTISIFERIESFCFVFDPYVTAYPIEISYSGSINSSFPYYFTTISDENNSQNFISKRKFTLLDNEHLFASIFSNTTLTTTSFKVKSNSIVAQSNCNVSFLPIISFEGINTDYYYDMSINCKMSKNGSFILYCVIPLSLSFVISLITCLVPYIKDRKKEKEVQFLLQQSQEGS